MLQASDVYVTPYLNMAQVTSGTLSYAVAVGKPVVSTPYLHARELLADDHGVLVEPADPAALAEAVGGLLDDDRQRAAMARRAYGRGRTMLWPRVVERALAPLAAEKRHTRHRGERRTTMLPLTAVERMSDGTGILQHGIHNIADRRHGYCIDDNARALILAVRRGRADPDGRRRRAGLDLCRLPPARLERGPRTLPQLHELRAHLARARRVRRQQRPHVVGARRHRGAVAVAGHPRVGADAVRA